MDWKQRVKCCVTTRTPRVLILTITDVDEMVELCWMPVREDFVLKSDAARDCWRR